MTDAKELHRVTSALPRGGRNRAFVPLAAALALVAAGVSGQNPAPAAAPSTQAAAPQLLLNERHPLPGMLTGGVPAGESAAPAFQSLAEAGVRTYIDLRADAEVPPETAVLAAAAGLDYRRLAIAGEADLDLASARALDLLLDECGRYPVALACSSGNRAGALLALRAFWLDGADAASALELGLAAGLTRLEPSVRLLLGLPSLPKTPEPPAAGPQNPPADGGANPPK